MLLCCAHQGTDALHLLAGGGLTPLAASKIKHGLAAAQQAGGARNQGIQRIKKRRVGRRELDLRVLVCA